MNLILVSGRHPPGDPRCDTDAEYAAALATAGHDVRWILPSPDPGAAREIEGVQVVVVPTALPSHRSVQAQLKDISTEGAVCREIRRELPDLVHLLHYGGATSVNVSWVSDRMGAPTIVTVDTPSTLCHRGDLVHESGVECEQWDDPVRCARCCLRHHGDKSLSRVGAFVGRVLGAVRSPFNPFPSEVAFLDRLELIIGGLQVVEWITVPSDVDRDRVVSLGLRRDQFTVLPDPSAETRSEWDQFYARVAGCDFAKA